MRHEAAGFAAPERELEWISTESENSVKPAETSGVFPIVTYSGGYSGGAPPLPMPNREVKPARADGTARKGGRVGRRRAYRGRRPGDQLGLRHRAASLRLWRPRCAYLMYLGRAPLGGIWDHRGNPV